MNTEQRDPAASIANAEHFAKWGVGTVEVHGKVSGEELKRPVGTEWQKRATTSPHTISERIERQAGQYGLKVLADSRMVGLDIDRPESFPWGTLPAGAVIIEHGLNGSGPGKCHAWLRLPEDYDALSLPSVRPWGEIANVTQRQLVGPGSLHPDGTLYRVRGGELPAEAPELGPLAAEAIFGELERFERKGHDPGGEDWEYQPNMGSRHELLKGRIRHWHGIGLSAATVEAEAWRYIERHKVPTTLSGRTITKAEIADLVRWAFANTSEDEPPRGEPDDEQGGATKVRTEQVKLKTVGYLGRRELRVRFMGDAHVHVEALYDGTPADNIGSATIGTIAGNTALAGQLAQSDPEGRGRDTHDAVRKAWLRLIVACYVAIEESRPPVWRDELKLLDGEDRGLQARLFPFVAKGSSSALFGHLSRYKTQTAMAWGISMLTGKALFPGTTVSERIDHYITVNYENSTADVVNTAMTICDGYGIDYDDVKDRIHVLTSKPPLPMLADMLLRKIETFPEDKPKVHCDLDSAGRAISTGQITKGDVWSAGADMLYNVWADVRRVSGLDDLSVVIIDHAGGERDVPKLDDEETWKRLRTYGARAKDQIARSVWAIGKFAVHPDRHTALVRIGPVKDWNNAPGEEDLWARYHWDNDEDGALTMETPNAQDVPTTRFPPGVKEGTWAARIYEAMVEDCDVQETDGGDIILIPKEYTPSEVADLLGDAELSDRKASVYLARGAKFGAFSKTTYGGWKVVLKL